MKNWTATVPGPLRPSRRRRVFKPVPYMITEYGGHMYPTKSFDQEQRQAEHATRYLEVINAAYGDPGIREPSAGAPSTTTRMRFRVGRPHLPSRRHGHVPRTKIRRLRLCQPVRPGGRPFSSR